MEEARDYQLAEHLIAHLMQDEVINDLVCGSVWDEQDQVDALQRVALGKPGSIAVTPAGFVPLLESGVQAPMVRLYAVLAVSCFVRASGAMPGGITSLRYLSRLTGRLLHLLRNWDPVMERICYDAPSVASVEDYDMSKSKLTGMRGKAVILYAPVNF